MSVPARRAACRARRRSFAFTVCVVNVVLLVPRIRRAFATSGARAQSGPTAVVAALCSRALKGLRRRRRTCCKSSSGVRVAVVLRLVVWTFAVVVVVLLGAVEVLASHCCVGVGRVNGFVVVVVAVVVDRALGAPPVGAAELHVVA